MARCKWCNSEIGDNIVCPQCKANQNGNISGTDIEYVSPFDKYGKNGPNKKSMTNSKCKSEENNIALMIRRVSIVIVIIGLVSGLVMFDKIGIIGIVLIISSLIYALIGYGFAEIIQLLQDIKNRL